MTPKKDPAPSTPAPRARRRAVTLRPDPLDEVAVPTPPAAVETAPPAAPVQQPKSAPARPADPEVDVDALGARPGESVPGEETFKMTVDIPGSLHRRASGVVRYAENTGEPEEIESLTDLVRNSLAAAVKEYEQRYNKGEPFPAPKRLRRGRRAG